MCNKRKGGTSGTLKIELLAINHYYKMKSGYSSNSYCLCSWTLDELKGGEYYTQIKKNSNLLCTPPDGTYPIKLHLYEYEDEDYKLVDTYSFKD